jgi:excisionase family DNA binding protein
MAHQLGQNRAEKQRLRNVAEAVLRGEAQRLTLTCEEAAALAGCGVAAIRRLVADGSIPCLRVTAKRRSVIIPREPFVRWVNGCGSLEAAAELGARGRER